MLIGDWKAAQELTVLYRQVRSLGLERHIAELEAFGFTVVEPEIMDAADLSRRMLEASVVAEREMMEKEAARPESAEPEAAPSIMMQAYQAVVRDPVFVEALLHPVVLTFARYLSGVSCRLNASLAVIKRGLVDACPLHVDIPATAPLPSVGLGCNVSWALTPYTRDRGTFAVVPASHRYCRPPLSADQPTIMGGTAEDVCIPVEAEVGSLIVLAGNLWHGTYPKCDAALRVHIVHAFCRHFVEPAEDFSALPDDMLAKHDPELARLLSRNKWQGFRAEGPDYDKIGKLERATHVPSA